MGLTREMFKYLAELASMNVRQTRTIDEWTVEGLSHPVTWLADVPQHQTVGSVLPGHPSTGDPTVVLRIRRPLVPDPPQAPAAWKAWSDHVGVEFDPAVEDVPLPHVDVNADEDGQELAEAASRAVVTYQSAVDQWRPTFEVASEVLALYSRLWQARRIVDTDPERFETIAAVGMIDWVPDGKPSRRPVLVAPARIDFDAEDQRIDVVIDAMAVTVETDMLPPTSKPSEEAVSRLRNALDEVESVFDASAVEEQLTGFVGDLPGSAGRGRWDPSIRFAPRTGRDPWLVFAPLVAVRPRSARARVDALAALADSDELSTALESMVKITDAHEALLPGDDEIADRFHEDALLPEPSSPSQRQMALSMERHPLTVVLGPPGTGKTYTIANLLGHLLAQGKRVLVTAEKEEALHEVRGKVLDELRSLVVPVLAGKAEDKTRLAQSISEISAARQQRRLADRQRAVEQLTGREHDLRRQRSALLNQLTAAWQTEQGDLVDAGPYRGGVERVADAVDEDRDRYEWLTDRPGSPTLPVADLSPVRGLMDAEVAAAARRTAPAADVADLPSAQHVDDLTQRRRQLDAELEQLQDVADRPSASAGPTGMDEADLLADALNEAAATLARLSSTPRGWVSALLDAARTDSLAIWHGRLERTRELADRINTAANLLGDRQVDAPAAASPATLRRAAAAIEDHLPEGKRLGRIVLKAEIREARADLEGTTVDGSPVDTAPEARAVVAWSDATQAASGLKAEWDGAEELTLSGPMRGWCDRIRPVADALADCLQLLDKADEALGPVRDAGVTLMDPRDAEQLRADARAVRINALAERRGGTLADLRSETDRIERSYRQHQFYDELIAALRAARDDADPAPWREALRRVAHEAALRQRVRAAESVLAQLASVVPDYVRCVRGGDEQALHQLDDLPRAAAWANAAASLERAASRAGLLEQLTEVEHELAATRRQIVSEQAWAQVHQRLEQQPQLSQALRDYAAAQKRVPKGKTAKSYLPNLRRAQRALERCAEAVPVWVMSVDRAAEMFGSGRPDLFDVVIVDEASQCPITSALVMQYARAVAIVGDPYQTSPPSFKRHDHLEAARRRISDEVVRDRLEPTSSLWTIADSVIDRITLTEHFRCPPEVIGWAQKHIYENIADLRLQVVTGTDPRRPKPVVAVDVPDGYRAGDCNDVEAERLLEELAEVLDDVPAWVRDIGVIALKPAQASSLQKAIFDRFDQRDLERFDLRVGTAYEFQGAQRDLVMISMVDSPPEAGKTHHRRTQDTDTLNQLNVAVSRARRQLRLYHSIQPGAYKTDDVRRWLLEHAIAEDRAWDARQTPGVPATVSETERVDPFDSLSEQRLFNQLVRAGYAVRPQVFAPVGGANYRLDLVVDGDIGAVAVEYDGPHHDTPRQYLEDREREQDLIRCGWTVVRVHHTDFNRDRSGTVAALQRQLREHGVTPVHEWRRSTALTDEDGVGEEADDQQDEANVQQRAAAEGTDGSPAAQPVPEVEDAPADATAEELDLASIPNAHIDASRHDEESGAAPGGPEPAGPAYSSGPGRGTDTTPLQAPVDDVLPPAETPSRSSTAASDRSGATAPPSTPGTAATGGESTDTLQLASRASALLAAGPLGIADLSSRLGVDGVVLDEVVQLLQSLGFARDGDTVREA